MSLTAKVRIRIFTKNNTEIIQKNAKSLRRLDCRSWPCTKIKIEYQSKVVHGALRYTIRNDIEKKLRNYEFL